MKTIRASRLPLLVACPASQTPPAVRVESDDAAARLGTATHEGMALMATGFPADAEALAAEHNVEADELRMLLGMGRRVLDVVGPHFPTPDVEWECSFGDADLTLTGHPDLLSVVDDEVRIADWKTERVERDATEQLKGYAWIAMNAKGRSSARVVKIAIRFQRADTLVFTLDELRSWWDWLKRHLEDEGSYRPGPHCSHCPRRFECPAHAKQLHYFALALTEPEHPLATDIIDLSPGDLLHAYRMVGVVAARCQEFREAVKARVKGCGGTLGRLTVTEKPRTSVNVERGWDAILEDLSTADLKALLKIGKSDLETAVKATAPRGQKGKAVAELMDRLARAGAIDTTYTECLEVLPDVHGDEIPTEAITAGECGPAVHAADVTG
jgi:hypothetical protein